MMTGVVGNGAAVLRYVAQEPGVVIAAVVVVLAVGGTAVWAVRRWWFRSPADRFAAALATREAVSVLMHPNPDPDAMACALAVGHLAASVDTDAVLQYPGRIRHQENRAFREVLDIEMERIADTGALRDDVVLVDHNEPRGFPGAGGVAPYAVVDHHPGDGEGVAFTDVRESYGACATLVAEYLDALDWTAEEDGEKRLPERVATGLMFGIQSDTTNLTRGCSMEEFDACSYLYPAADAEALDRIANPEVDVEVLDVRARAIARREIEDSYLVSDVGEVENVDAIAQAADELLRLQGVTAVVVCGDNDGTLHMSGRSRDDDLHVGQALKSAVEGLPMADAGGHARMGGGQVSVAHMEGLGPGTGISRGYFHDLLFAALAGNGNGHENAKADGYRGDGDRDA